MEISYLKNKSTEKLETELKSIKEIKLSLILIIISLYGASIYGLLNMENRPLFLAISIIGLVCISILAVQLTNIKKLKIELNKRKV